MADISISLSNIQNIKTVNIEGLGVLKIRKLGAGEDLDLSFKQRRLGKILNELTSIDFTGLDLTKASDAKKLEKMSKRAETLSEEAAEIKKFEFETYKRLLSDDKGGKIVDVIMNTLTEQERAELFKQIFGEKTIEAPESITPEDEDE